MFWLNSWLFVMFNKDMMFIGEVVLVSGIVFDF